MKRRHFIKYGSTIAGGILAFPSIVSSQTLIENTVMVTGGEPAEMLIRGITELGGLEQFIQKGQNILIKPDIGRNTTPEEGFDTNPMLIKQLVEMCYEVKARSVKIVDHTYDTWTKCYKNSGIERAAKDARAKILPGNVESFYQKVEIPEAKKLKEVFIHEAALEADIIINVPAIRKDSETTIAGCIRNLMGLTWNWDDFYELEMDQCLADLLHFKNPVLNIADGYRIADIDNPGEIKLAKTLVLSNNIVNADVAVSRLLNISPSEVKHLVDASESGFGDINSPSIKKITI